MSIAPGTVREIANSDSQAGGIRAYLRLHYLEPARLRGETFVTLRAGDIHKELGLSNRVPNVCQVMESRILEREARVKVSSKQGPPKGRGTTFTVTYAVDPVTSDAEPSPESVTGAETQVEEVGQSDGVRLFFELRGTLKDAFAAAGGGEAWLRKERDGFYGPFSRKKML